MILTYLLFLPLLVCLSIGQSRAGNFFVTSLAEMNAAVVEAQSDTVADTIHIQNSFFLNAADELPQINTEITINGNNHTLSRAAGNTDDFSFIFVAPGGDVTVNDLTVSGVNESVFILSNFASQQPELTLNNVTLRENKPLVMFSGLLGGAIRNNGGSVTLNSSTLTDNEAARGGGIYTFSGSVILNQTTVANNSASLWGGGVYMSSGDLSPAEVTLNSSQIIDNQAVEGGGVYIDGDSIDWLFTPQNPELASSISRNNASQHGGGIYARGSRVNLNYTNTSSNTAGLNGGGIYLDVASSLELFAATVSRNSTMGGNGGGIFMQDITANNNCIRHSTISNNEGLSGGGVYMESSQCTISESTISDNVATNRGGGLYATNLSGDGLSISSSTITFNQSGSSLSGSGIHLDGSGTSNTVLLENTIVSDSVDWLDCNNHPGFAADAFNIIENASENGVSVIGCATAANKVNPDLGALQDNGGPTRTRAPKEGSFAIDNGDASICFGTDQRFLPRGAASCFIGAVEGIHVDLTDFFVIPDQNGNAIVVPL